MRSNETESNETENGRPNLAEVSLWVVTLASILFVFVTFRDYGFTTDEGNGYQRALNVFKFLASLGQDTSGVSDLNLLSIYGAMPDVTALILQKVFPSLGFDARHFVSGMFGVVGVYYSGRLAAY